MRGGFSAAPLLFAEAAGSAGDRCHAGGSSRLGRLRTRSGAGLSSRSVPQTTTPPGRRSRPCPGQASRVRVRPVGHLHRNKGAPLANDVGIRELLEAGVHFGHQTRRWNPRCAASSSASATGSTSSICRRPSVCSSRPGVRGRVAVRGGTILFVGTKKQARDTIKEAATAGMPYVDQRWLGGLLTNFQTISKRIKRLARAARLDRDPAR